MPHIHRTRPGARRSLTGLLAAALLPLPAVATTAAYAAPASPARATAPLGAALPPAPQGSPYPSVGAGTHFLDDAALLGNINEKSWYEANIPFVDLPDQTIQSVYYYRWNVWKEHIRPTGTANGDILTEFFGYPGYAAPYGAIDAAAGHHIDEGRWVRDQSYLNSYIDYWLQNAGSGPKPATDAVNANQTDWAHEYSFWLASAVVARSEVTGDWTQARSLLPELVKQYDTWDNQFNPKLGLYWQVPVWDAMELSASSYESDPSDPYHGGAGYRPTLNAYQYGDAQAISFIAGMAHDTQLASTFSARAAALRRNMQKWLWDPARQFFYDMPAASNPGNQLLSAREEIGFVPWMFNMPNGSDSVAWKQLLDPSGFAAAYGPTTVEQRSNWFMYQASHGCCHWDGPSWPYATSQTLTAMANLLDNYRQSDVTAADYDALLHTYAATQSENGVPHVGQAHDPAQPSWIYDATDYNHSSFNDLVLSGLLGLRAQTAPSLLSFRPLVPPSWTYFAVENAPYHGHNITVLWDKDGTRYSQGRGLHIYEDGRLLASSATLRALNVHLRPDRGAGAVPAENFTDLAANVYGQGSPSPFASYTWQYDSTANGTDGQIIYDDSPLDSRWTDYGSPNATDDLGVDFGAVVPLDEVRIYTYDDTANGGDVKAPAAYTVQYWTGSAWADVPGQIQGPSVPAGDDLNRVTFPAITTSQIRVVFTRQPGYAVGASELEAGGASAEAGGIWIDGPKAVTVPLKPDQPNTITTSLSGAAAAGGQGLITQLVAPAGWVVQRVGPAQATPTTTWTVTPPAGSAGDSAALYAYAIDSQPGSSGIFYGRVATSVAFSLQPYTDQQVSDSFTTSDLSAYTQVLPAVTSSTGEQLPAFTAGGGQMQASLPTPFFGVLQSGTAPASDKAVSVLDAKQFLGDATSQDSLFTGFVKDAGDYVMAWYNNVYRTSGIDLVQGGRLNPPGYQVPCCASVTLQSGDRFALAVDGATVTSYVQHTGSDTWQQLETTSISPFVDLSDPATLAQYHYAFGLRGDGGTMAASRFQGLAVPAP